VVNPNVPANNMAEFVAWARTQGDTGITWSNRPAAAARPHFAAEMFKEATGVNVTIVPYRSGNDGVNAVLSNSASVTSEASIVVLPQIKAGLLKAITTTYEKARERVPLIEDHGGAGISGRRDRPLGRLVGAARNTRADHCAHECRAGPRSNTAEVHDRPRREPAIESAAGSVAEFAAFIAAERQRLGALAAKARMSAEQ